MTKGFWRTAPLELGGGAVRMINNTVDCEGPLLFLFRDGPEDEGPPDYVEWGTMPDGWVVDGAMKLLLLRGTLVPQATAARPGRLSQAGLGGRKRARPAELPRALVAVDSPFANSEQAGTGEVDFAQSDWELDCDGLFQRKDGKPY